jgi:hypothetical protein
LLFLGLLVGFGVPVGTASAGPLAGVQGAAAETRGTAVQTVADSAAAQKKQAAALQRKKKQQQAAQAAKAKAAAQQKKEKDEWYAKDRDRGLDVAEKYAPKAIAKVRKNDYVAKGDTVSTGDGKKGWRHYMDKYYSR